MIDLNRVKELSSRKPDMVMIYDHMGEGIGIRTYMYSYHDDRADAIRSFYHNGNDVLAHNGVIMAIRGDIVAALKENNQIDE